MVSVVKCGLDAFSLPDEIESEGFMLVRAIADPEPEDEIKYTVL